MAIATRTLSQEIATLANSPDYFLTTQNFLPNPDKILRKAGKQYDAYDEVWSDSRVKAVFRTRKGALMNLEWNIEGKNTEQTKFVQENVKRVGFSKLINDIFKAIPWGFQPIELIWKPEGGKWILLRIDAKPQKYFAFQPDTEKLMFINKSSYDYKEVPDNKFICPQFDYEYGNPYGNPMLADLFWDVFFKKNGIRFYSDFIERYAKPFLVGKHIDGESKDKIDAFLAQIVSLINGGAAAVSENTSIEAMNAGDSSNNDAYVKFIQMWNDDIATVVLGGNLLTDTRSGSFAASKSQENVKDDIRDSDAEFVMQNINKLIKILIDLNYGEQVEYPEFNFIWQDEVLTDLATYNKTMTEVGVEFTAEYFIRKHKLLETDFKIKPPTVSTPAKVANFAESSGFNFNGESGQDLIDSAVDRMKKSDMDKMSMEMLKPIVDMVQSSADYSECLSKIAKVFPRMNTKSMQEMLDTALGMSQIIGEESQKTDLEMSLK